MKFSLNPSVAVSGEASLSLNSPSRGNVTFTKSLSSLGSGFFSISLDIADTALLEDDTYSYILSQGGTEIKVGRIRLLDSDVAQDGVLDAVLNQLLA